MFPNNVEGKSLFIEQLQLLKVGVKGQQHFGTSNEIMSDHQWILRS